METLFHHYANAGDSENSGHKNGKEEEVWKAFKIMFGNYEEEK